MRGLRMVAIAGLVEPTSANPQPDVVLPGTAILITDAGFVALNVVGHPLTAGRAVVGLDRIALPARAQRRFAALPGRFTFIGGSILSTADLRRPLPSRRSRR